MFRVVYRGLEAVVVVAVAGTEVAMEGMEATVVKAMEVAILVTVDTEVEVEVEVEASGIPGPPIHFTLPVQMIPNARHIAQI